MVKSRTPTSTALRLATYHIWMVPSTQLWQFPRLTWHVKCAISLTTTHTCCCVTSATWAGIHTVWTHHCWNCLRLYNHGCVPHCIAAGVTYLQLADVVRDRVACRSAAPPAETSDQQWKQKHLAADKHALSQNSLLVRRVTYIKGGKEVVRWGTVHCREPHYRILILYMNHII